MENWMEKFRLNECFMVLSVLLSFLMLAVLGQRKTWISTESIMMCISGAAFFLFPQQVLTIGINGQLDEIGIRVGMFFGLTLICFGCSWLFVKETRDGTVAISVLQSRAFASLCLVIMQCFAYLGQKTHSAANSKDSKSIQFSDQMFFLGIFPTFIWLIGNLLHLARSFDFNSFPQHNISLNNHLKLEAMVSFSLGVVFLAFPSQVLQYIFKNNGNKVSLHMMRSIGCLHIGSSMLAIQAPGFLHERDKKTILLIRMITSVLQLGCYCFWLLKKYSESYWSALIFLPYFGNAFIGYCWGGTNVYSPLSAKVASQTCLSKTN